MSHFVLLLYFTMGCIKITYDNLKKTVGVIKTTINVKERSGCYEKEI